MDCEVCLSHNPSAEKNILRTTGASADEIRDLLRGINYRSESWLGGVDLFFSSREDLLKARERLGEIAYSEGEPLEKVVGDLLRDRSLTLSTAESCTGGLLSARIVNVPGSSDYFVGGVVAYSNEIKKRFLGVRDQTLQDFGAVSSQTCGEMLEGLRRNFLTDAGIAITGIAGPGGSERKPEGLTYIGAFLKKEEVIEEKIFEGSRNEKRFKSTQRALDLLRRMLLKEE